jgi:flagellar basal-body rod protein FlgG
VNGIFYIGATGLNAQQTAVDIVANNVTNMNTTAYKRGSVSFSELLAPAAPLPGITRSVSPEAGAAGVMVNPTLHDFTAAELHATGNAMDLAIRGDGFIPLAKSSDGQSVLWRGGPLHVGTDGYLAAPDGQPLEAMISVPRDSTGLTISPSGQVTATVPNQTDPVEIGQIDVVVPSDTSKLQSQGNGIYSLDESETSLSSGTPGVDGAGLLAQGYGEASNVQLSDELVNLMIFQRAYAANARLVQVGDELMSIANGLKR